MGGKGYEGEKTIDAEERILNAGYEDVIILHSFSYDDALIGVTEDNRAVYDFCLMVKWLCKREGWNETEAIDWIEFNVIRALPYMGELSPIIMHRV